ncbi:MAG: DinB family protein [Planctomycetota bacterium]
MSVGYMHRLLADVTAAQFARLPSIRGTVIESNHPAFILGHLSLYPCRIVKTLSGDSSSIDPTEKYNALFSPSASCLDDPDGTLYPSMEEITTKFFQAHEAAIEAVINADETQFSSPNENERMQSRFATTGSMHAFYLGGHIMIHVGQFSAWRRMMGLGPA